MNPLAVAIVLAAAFALIAAGFVVGWVARPFDGAHLLAAPALIAAGGALIVRIHVVAGRTAR